MNRYVENRYLKNQVVLRLPRPAEFHALALWSLFFVFCILFLGCTTNDAPDLPEQAAPFVANMHQAFEGNDFKAALAFADSAASYAPDYPEINYVRGQIYTAMRRYADAEAAFSSALASSPDLPGAWYQRGHNAFMQRKYREALSYYEQERELVASSSDTKPAATPTETGLPAITAQIGRTYALLGNPDSAKIYYEQAIEADSLLPVAHAWMSELYENAGQLNDALRHALAALQANPNEVEYGYRVGLMLFQLGRAEEALPYFNTVVQFWPAHEGAVFNLGRTLQVLGREEEGQRFIDRIPEIRALHQQAMLAEQQVETYPDNPDHWIELGGYMMQMGYRDRAESALSAAVALKPDELSLLSDLANIAFSRGDTTTAIARYRTLLNRDPQFSSGWLNLGVMYAMMGKTEEARNAWQTVLRLDPEDADARRYLQQLDQQAGQ